MEDTPSTRRSTGERIGPWFVLQRKNPTAPGLRLSVLLTLARRGHITPKSIVRGPTTGQFWRYAAQVKGLSRVFGVCWHCGAGVSPDTTTCPKCRSAQEIPDDPDQFLENHSAMPVMREISQSKDDSFESDAENSLPLERQSLSDLRGNSRGDPATRDPRLLPGPGSARASRSSPGTRSMTLARGDEDMILSASELAAAFQLDLPPTGGVRRVSGRLWRVTKIAALLALLLAGGTATAFYLKPQWYQQANEFARPYLEKSQSWLAKVTGRGAKKAAALEDLGGLPPITPIQLESSPESKPPTAVPANPDQIDQADKSAMPRFRPANGTLIMPPVDSNAPIDALGGGTSVFVPTTRPLPSSAQVAEIPNIFESIRAKQQPAQSNQPTEAESAADKKPEPESTVQHPATSATDLSKLSPEEAIAAAATLRTSALDAEARRDWAAAVLIYEQISKLPEAAHPSDLKVKLAVARERARS